jgi:hypothetical protein
VLFEQVPHWCGMMSRVGRFGKALAAPPVAGDISVALPRMVRNSRRLMGSSSDRELTLSHCQSAVLCITADFGSECPLWVISRHFVTFARCPLYLRKRTSTKRVTNVRYVAAAFE